MTAGNGTAAFPVAVSPDPFTISDSAYKYRPLKRGDSGWDIYALQTALNVFAEPDIVTDGVFGDRTHQAVTRYQRNRDLVADGIAGIVTQRSLAIGVGNRVKQDVQLPTGLLKGVFEKESGYQLGNHTAKYPNGTWDLGVVQRNTAYHPVEESFDVLESVDYYARRVRAAYERYQDGLTTQYAWELAAGSWNAPSWTDRLAVGKTISDSAKEWIDGYIDRVTTYVTSWPA